MEPLPILTALRARRRRLPWGLAAAVALAGVVVAAAITLAR
jgi:hypothetical protein